MAPAFQSTLTPTPAAASWDILVFCVMSRTKMEPIPVASLTVNMASVECQVWGRHTASVTAATPARHVNEVSSADENVPPTFA